MTGKLLVAFLLATFGPLASAQTLIPLETWEKSRSDWKNDPTEVAYVVFRCGTLFDLLGRVFVENGTTSGQRDDGQKMISRADGLLTTGTALSFNTGMSEPRLLERAKAFFDIYGRQIVENRRLHNDMFEGLVGKDFQFCVSRYAFMDELGKRLSDGKR